MRLIGHELIEGGSQFFVCLFVSCVCVLYNAQHSFLHFGNARYMVAEGCDASRGLAKDIKITR